MIYALEYGSEVEKSILEVVLLALNRMQKRQARKESDDQLALAMKIMMGIGFTEAAKNEPRLAVP